MFRKILSIITLPDKILIGSLLFIAVFSVYYLKASDSSVKLEVFVDNELQGVYDMDRDQLVPITDGIIVEISEGRVRMKESTCKNQICVRQGYSRSLPIICAPEKVALIVKRKQDVNIMITR